jgi:serine/threonine protein phosphatase PrpC
MNRLHTSITCFGISDRGLQRTNNEDHFIVADLTRKTVAVEENCVTLPLVCHEMGPKGTLLAVADGLGGYEGGEMASQIAVETTVRALFAAENDLPPTQQLGLAIQEAHQAICWRRTSAGGHPHMASTLTAVHVGDGILTVAQIGDSRAYLFRNGILTLLTEDQTIVHSMQKRGVLTEAEASIHPLRHLILQALGQDSAVCPAVHTYSFLSDDWVLLCTDGLSSYVSTEQIVTLLASEADAPTRCRALINAANACGGADNVTVLLARLVVHHGHAP